MRKLDGELGMPDAAGMIDDPHQPRFAVIGIEAEAAVGDAAAPFDVGGLDDQ